ncbi:hypothetical protein OO012_06145 [Rhodobacteraceae bacterium KMM 6894]|nr:hypothetical protein [Rhodobacteraceae bacterium KMM 6894]
MTRYADAFSHSRGAVADDFQLNGDFRIQFWCGNAASPKPVFIVLAALKYSKIYCASKTGMTEWDWRDGMRFVLALEGM